MKTKLLLVVFWLCLSQTAFALSPYLRADKLGAADLPTLMTQVEKKLTAEGFTLAGRYVPRGSAQHGTVVVTDPGMLLAIRNLGGSAGGNCRTIR